MVVAFNLDAFKHIRLFQLKELGNAGLHLYTNGRVAQVDLNSRRSFI